MKRLKQALLLGLLWPLAAGATVTERTLENGLKVIVKEDHRAPVAVAQIWYKVGSSYEHIGLTGISHVLEHLMFKGTEQVGPGEFSRRISAQGGSENAFTGLDYTAYFQQLAADRLAISFELEADRMRHLQFDAAEFDKERKVVIEERRLRTEDQPSALTQEQFMATAFQVNPYHNPVIGWLDDLEALTVEDMRVWYHTWYAPNNATLVVAGDVQPEAIFALAEKWYGPLEPSTIAPPKPRREPEQRGERRVTVKAVAELPTLYMGYQGLNLKSAKAPWKAYALELLAYILDGGDSARLSRELVRGQQIAASVSTGNDLYTAHTGLFTFTAVPTQGHTVAELELALRAQVARLREELVDPAELARIKAQLKASKVFERDSVFYQAMQIGQLETVGLDWRLGEEYLDQIAALTPEQLREAAREFLVDERLTVAILEPVSITPAPDTSLVQREAQEATPDAQH